MLTLTRISIMLKFFKYNRHYLNLLLAVMVVGLFAFFYLYEPAPKAGRLQGLDEITPYEPPFTKEGSLAFLNAQGDSIIGIDIEIADDQGSRGDGLMHRYTLAEQQGMLFIFDRAEPQNFWMRNTHISLDIIYVGSDSVIVSIARNTPVRSDQTIPSHYPAQYVVEVNAGFCARHQVEVGDRIAFIR